MLRQNPSRGMIEQLPFDEAIVRARGVVQGSLEQVLPAASSDDLQNAMRYSIVGGKALRAFLVLEGARLHKVAIGPASLAGLAIECIHAYSLVHDDLPSMDDDDLRRGRPTIHKKWDEATAVLAGDALQALAFYLLSHPSIGSAEVSRNLVFKLSYAAGYHGMVGGQMLDIAAEKKKTGHTYSEIEGIQKGKTGALIQWSAMAGAELADANSEALYEYGQSLGLAFQIADDILDIEGDAETVGKAVGKDTTAGKATFVSHLGLDGAKSRASELVEAACDALSPYGEDADTLREAARFVITRKK